MNKRPGFSVCGCAAILALSALPAYPVNKPPQRDVQTPNPPPSTLNPQPSTIPPEPSTIPPEPLTIPPEPLTLNHSSLPFSRYQIILDRRPFGAEPAPLPPVSATPPPPPPETVTRTLKMCAVTRRLNGKLQVGLVETAAKKNYLIDVGDTADGITVLEADYEGEKAKLSKDGVEAWISMNDVKSMPGLASVVPSPAVPAPALGMTRRSGVALPDGRTSVARAEASVSPVQPPVPSPAAPVQPSASATVSGRAKLKEMHEEERRKRVVEAATAQAGLTHPQLEQRLRDYQMDLIRARGEKGPPLPMELTPEMDAQLVKEGVLPPQAP